MPKTNNLKNIVYDEFYTRLEDIATGSSAYNHFFKGKTIYCNCDDYAKSNFVRYFRYNFQKLGLKKLISTSYNAAGQGIFYSYNGTTSRTKALDGNGDFRSTECIKLLKQADIVVTNPPFSLFREHINLLYKHNKQFLTVGNQQSLMYPEVFRAFQHNKLFWGKGFKGNVGFFISDYPNIVSKRNLFKEGCIRVSGITWYTNLPTEPNQFVSLCCKFDATYYPHYDNYKAIEVSKTRDIPMDYDGVMGVPISFLHKYNPDQFEIVQFRKGNNNKDLSIDGKYPFFRILIKHKKK